MKPPVRNPLVALTLALLVALPATAQDEPLVPQSEAEQQLRDMRLQQRTLDLDACKQALALELDVRKPLLSDNWTDDPVGRRMREFVSYLYADSPFLEATEFSGTPEEVRQCKDMQALLLAYKAALPAREMTDPFFIAYTNSLGIRHKKLLDAVEWCNSTDFGTGYIKQLEDYNKKYLEFMAITERLAAHQPLPGVKAKSEKYPWNVEFIDVLKHTGLLTYFTEAFNTRMVDLNGKVVAINGLMNHQKDIIKIVRERWTKTNARLTNVAEMMEKRRDYEYIAPLIAADKQILQHFEEMLKEAEAVQKQFEDTGTPAGRLRTSEGLAPDALKGLARDSSRPPAYSRLLLHSRHRLEDAWNKAAKKLDSEHEGDPDWHRMTVNFKR
jgi:hypothetical protein